MLNTYSLHPLSLSLPPFLPSFYVKMTFLCFLFSYVYSLVSRVKMQATYNTRKDGKPGDLHGRLNLCDFLLTFDSLHGNVFISKDSVCVMFACV